jgi:hypothetical protein
VRILGAATVIAIAVTTGCGGGGGDGPGSDADPGPVDPIFDDADGRDRVDLVEGVWPGVGSAWAGVTAWFSDTPALLTESARAGACRLLVSDVMYCEGCEGFCAGGVCRDWPVGRSAGTITIGGLVRPLTLTWMNDYYAQSPQPQPGDDLFAPDAAITVAAAGDEVAGFTAHVGGVAPIAPRLAGACANELHVTHGEDLAITWPDPVAGARVRLRLPSPNNGHGMPPRAVIECEGRDTGAFTVPAALIDGLPDLVETDACAGVACAGFDCPPASLARYTRATAAAGAETVVVRAEAEVDFYLFDN